MISSICNGIVCVCKVIKGLFTFAQKLQKTQWFSLSSGILRYINFPTIILNSLFLFAQKLLASRICFTFFDFKWFCFCCYPLDLNMVKASEDLCCDAHNLAWKKCFTPACFYSFILNHCHLVYEQISVVLLCLCDYVSCTLFSQWQAWQY